MKTHGRYPRKLNFGIVTREAPKPITPQKRWDALQTIHDSDADVVVEMSYTNLETGEPAAGHVRAALEAGKLVAMINKDPMALHYPGQAALPEQTNLHIEAEGTVMSPWSVLRRDG